MPTRATIVIPGYPGAVLRAAAKPNAPVPEQPFRPDPLSVNPNFPFNGDLVWPPSLIEFTINKTQVTKRLESKSIVPVCPIYQYDPTWVPGILSVAFVGGDLSRALDEIVSASGLDPARYALGFGYDWRRDLTIAAQSLADFIQTYCEDAEEVVIVAHSTGGRVARYMLEAKNFGQEPWFRKIKHLVMVAVPNEGTAIALSALVGIEVSPMIDAAESAPIINSDPYFCGLYQLLPHNGTTCAFDKTATGEKPIDIYSKPGAKKFGLNWDSVERAIAFRDALDKGKRPAGVRYTRFYGEDIDTALKVVRTGNTFSMVTTKFGDGTVTKDSAIGGPKGGKPIALSGVAHHAMATYAGVIQELRDIYGAAKPMVGDFHFPIAKAEATPTLLSMTAAPSQWASGADRFPICLPLILEHEGGYVDHPQDPGGATNLGITIGTLSRWLGRPATKAEVRALTPASVAPIYRAYYWLPVKGDAMPAGVDYALFDYAVNSGVGRAVRHLQDILGVTVDGAIGAETMAEIGRQNPDFVIRALCERRLDYLKSLPTWPTFGRGWERRVQKVEDRALEMATGVPHGANSGIPSAPAPRVRRQTRPTPPPGP